MPLTLPNVGKRSEPTLIAQNVGRAYTRRRLQPKDSLSMRAFLLRTNVKLSLLLPLVIDQLKTPDLNHLKAVNGASIAVNCYKTFTLSLGLRRQFSWSFIVAVVPISMLGAGFLSKFYLLVDIKKNRLIDKVIDFFSSGLQGA